MKFNWGNGIFFVLLFFVLACVAFFIYTRTVDWTLVEEDYYARELKHEQVLIKIRNYKALPEPLVIRVTQLSVDIQFPAYFKGQKNSGRILVYRPSDKTLDYSLPVNIDSTMTESIPRSRFRHGNYVIKIDWFASGKGYYNEQELFIP